MTARPWVLAVMMGFASALLPVQAMADSKGAQLYKRCAACHLGTGAGVPGSFPPLDNHVAAFAATPEGRNYLVMVVTAGLSGEITVNDRRYRGFMVAQTGLGDADVAAVLNHVLTDIIKPPATAPAFAAEEVTKIRDRHKGIKATEVIKLRPVAAPDKKKGKADK